MKKLNSTLLIFILICFQTILSQTPNPVGQWKFDEPTNLTKSEIGTDLELVGSQESVEGPAAGNGAAKIGIGSYYKMTHGIIANGGGIRVNEYSIQIDFKIPANGTWYSFFQTNPANSDDGDCFINTTGNIGVAATGYSNMQVKNDEWYRLIVSVKNGLQYKYYLDGQLIQNGNVQVIDGRFSLNDVLLIFADNDGEDSEISCAELKIWNYSLSEQEIKNLGGFGHQTGIKQLVLHPYLQTPTPNSIYVCWHDTASAFTRVEYGTTEALGQTTTGTSEIISDPYRWHTVKLTGLQPNTSYFYKAVSGTGESKVYSFKTFPDSGFTGKIRILQFSDTHSNDTTMASKVIRAAKQKVEQLYGSDFQNQVNLVLHSGDLVVSGNAVNQFTDQYFAPFSPISPYVPIMTTIGNHEGESQFYYDYFHYDDFSFLPAPNAQNEKFYSFTIGNTAIISLNTNIVKSAGVLQKILVEAKLKEFENDPKIDFVFFIFHHMPFTELWVEALTFDAGPKWVLNELFPILKKYSKVQQVTYGHTHAFERGTIESDKDNGDFRIVCAGGGGGETDNWGEFINHDYPQIHVALDHYHFQLMEIDVAKKSYESSMYSLGNASKPLNSKLMDRWYRKLNQTAPGKPVANNPIKSTNNLVFNSSAYSGSDSLMSSRIQISDNPNFNPTVIDSISNWEDIYGVDSNFNPIDKNAGIDLTKLTLTKSHFADNKQYYYRVRYRDHNLRWSAWSDNVPFDISTGVEDNSVPTVYALQQNFPNPFNPTTTIHYQIPEAGFVSLKIYDILGKELFVLVNEDKQVGRYDLHFNAGNLSSGIYYYQLKAGNFVSTKKLILIK
ncbi:MAG: metallophosphoesterase [Ignavibacteriales bacterium]|nr:metallophosphoesterase [Ignavibacteriales bacterium]